MGGIFARLFRSKRRAEPRHFSGDKESGDKEPPYLKHSLNASNQQGGSTPLLNSSSSRSDVAVSEDVYPVYTSSGGRRGTRRRSHRNHNRKSLKRR